MTEHRPAAAPNRSVIARRVAGARAAIENLRPLELAAELTTASRVIVVDVRSPDEHAEGAIAGSINVPRGMIEASIGSRADLDRRVVLYCETGDRSALAAASLYELGYRDVAHLDGGIVAWRVAELPLVVPSPAAPVTTVDGWG